MYNTIRIKAGDGGWGGPLTITPTEKCHTILSVTGGGIHPVAQKLAELTGGEEAYRPGCIMLEGPALTQASLKAGDMIEIY